MTNNPTAWMYAAQEDCCDRYYSWNKVKCMGIVAGAPAASGTSKWYADYSTDKCVKDCVGAGCGGIAEPWDILYDTKKSCCTERIWWNDDCEL